MKLRTAKKICNRADKESYKYTQLNDKYPLFQEKITKGIYGILHRQFVKYRRANKRWDEAYDRLHKYHRHYWKANEYTFRSLFFNMGHGTWKRLKAKARKEHVCPNSVKKRFRVKKPTL